MKKIYSNIKYNFKRNFTINNEFKNKNNLISNNDHIKIKDFICENIKNNLKNNYVMKENFEKIINDQNVIIQHLKNEIIDTKLKYKILLDKFSNYFDKIKNTELKTENTEQKRS